MKTKTKSGSSSVARASQICDEMHKLGFGGGLLNSSRALLTHAFSLRGRSPLVAHGSRPGGSRQRSFPLCVVTFQFKVKDSVVTWDYDDAVSDRYAKGSSGLHSRLVRIFGDKVKKQ